MAAAAVWCDNAACSPACCSKICSRAYPLLPGSPKIGGFQPACCSTGRPSHRRSTVGDLQPGTRARSPASSPPRAPFASASGNRGAMVSITGIPTAGSAPSLPPAAAAARGGAAAAGIQGTRLEGGAPQRATVICDSPSACSWAAQARWAGGQPAAWPAAWPAGGPDGPACLKRRLLGLDLKREAHRACTVLAAIEGPLAPSSRRAAPLTRQLAAVIAPSGLVGRKCPPAVRWQALPS